MKKIVISIGLVLMLLLSACGTNQAAAPGLSATATPTPLTAAAGPEGTAQPEAPSEQPETPAPTHQSNKPYDPSIFVIEAAGTWRQELAPEYYADYECEIYLHKIDSNDNRAVAGSYQGMFWIITKLDASGYIEDMIKDVPMDVSFDAGAEAVCDNLGISLNTEDDKAWVDYSIPGEDGKPLPLTQDTPVAKGSFVAVAKDVYLAAKAQDTQGLTVDYETQEGTGDEIDINYVIHVQPDAMEAGGQRDVVIHLTGSDGIDVTLEGTMRRLPGYPEDVAEYLNSAAYRQAAQSHLE